MTVPIAAVTGGNGAGKSMFAARLAARSAARGGAVWSTATLLDPATGQPHPAWQPLDSWESLMQARNGLVWLDEVTGVLGARDTMGLPPEVLDRLVQLRRRNVRVVWTAPSWRHADTMLRSVTQRVYVVRPIIRTGGGIDSWPVTRLSRVTAWMPEDLTDDDGSPREKAKPVWRGWLAPAHSQWRHHYDSSAPVLRLGHMTQKGTCSVCGGRRSVPRCECGESHAHGAPLAVAASAEPPRRPGAGGSLSQVRARRVPTRSP